MTTARKLLLLALTALAAMAFAATSASAVEFVSEGGGAECTAAPSNCQVVAEGVSHITALPSGVIVSRCQDDFTINWNHDGTGNVTWSGVTYTMPACNTTNCEEMNSTWPIHSSVEIGANLIQTHIEFCLRTPGTHGEIECEGLVDVNETSMAHQYRIRGTISCLGGARRVEVDATTHGASIELIH